MSLFRRKPIETDLAKDTGLKRVLTAFDLTLLGVERSSAPASSS